MSKPFHIQALAQSLKNAIVNASPARRKAIRRNEHLRNIGLDYLNTFSRKTARDPAYQRVLVDGQWDNANFWLRYAVIRSAFGLSQATEIGIIGKHSSKRVEAAFQAFGITDTINFNGHAGARQEHYADARAILSQISRAEDLLNTEYPLNFPAAIVYDSLLKRQRRALVDIHDPDLVRHLANSLHAICESRTIIAEGGYDLLVTSHAIEPAYAGLVWAAIDHGIPTIVAAGDYGTARFIRIETCDDIFCYPPRPDPTVRETTPSSRRARLQEAGEQHVSLRLNGETSDVASIYAFKRRTGRIDRSDICDKFKWDKSKPVIAVYAPNWFDYPHFVPSMPYRDYFDWMELTVRSAAEADDVQWLFKAHPCDEWYGVMQGETLADLVANQGARNNIAIADPSWNGRDLLVAVDGLVTVHGTAGLEATMVGTPVLLPYPGWYGDAGFTYTCSGREAYLSTLHRAWWEEVDTPAACKSCAEFCGWYFCAPDWGEDYVYHDDSRQDSIYWDLVSFLETNDTAVAREIAMIQDWWRTRAKYYNIFKNSQSDRFVPIRSKDDSPAIDPRQLALLPDKHI